MANLTVTFTGTTPNQMADLSTMVMAIGPTTGPYSQLLITTPSGYTPIQGTLTSGTSPLFNISGVGGPYLTFYNNRTGEKVMSWKFLSAANATTAYGAILAKLNAVLGGGTAVQAISCTNAGVVANL